MTSGRRLRFLLCFILFFFLRCPAYPAATQDQAGQGGKQGPVTQRDINDVLRDHDKELLAIPGIVGVYAGLLPDGKTPCLKVMVVKETDELKKKIPDSIEGYPVIIMESGIVRPLKD